MLTTALLICSMLLFSSCGKDYFFSGTTDLPQQIWTYENTPEFSVTIDDTDAIYHLLLDIEHSVDFSYQNIYLKFHATDPSGAETVTQIPINFANKGGIWYGDCNREWCHLEGFLQKNLKLSAKGIYHFKLEQFMRVEQLSGVKSVGIKVEKQKS